MRETVAVRKGHEMKRRTVIVAVIRFPDGVGVAACRVLVLLGSDITRLAAAAFVT